MGDASRLFGAGAGGRISQPRGRRRCVVPGPGQLHQRVPTA